MRSLIYILLFTSLFFPNRCEREVWDRSCDLTQTLTENEDIAGDRDVYQECTKAPIRIRFRDEDDGYFYFSENSEEIPFKFIDEGNNIYKVKYGDEEEEEEQEEVIEVAEFDGETVKVRFFWGSIWIVYTKR